VSVAAGAYASSLPRRVKSSRGWVGTKVATATADILLTIADASCGVSANACGL